MIESALLQTIGGYIDGRWAGQDAHSTIRVSNPATGKHLADVADMGGNEASEAVEAAARASGLETSCEQRSRWLLRISELLIQRKEDLARIITQEQGKPLKESRVEVEYSAGFFGFYAKHTGELSPRRLPEAVRNLRWTIHHRPASVAVLITPWNFPLAMLAKKFSAALAAGCTSVTKPAELTPLTAIAFWKLLEQIELPKGMANLVIGRPAPIGDVFCSHPAVRILSFTGSTATGKLLIAKTAQYIKRLAMELGGNAPYLVFDDADLSVAADALMANKFRCAGQTCVCANRVYVHRSVAREFQDLLSSRISRLRVGNGLEDSTDIGPLINRHAFDKVDRHVTDAIARGASKVVGANATKSREAWGNFYPPTLLIGARDEMAISREETFGPVVALTEFDDEQRVIRQANGTPFGLASYIFTGNSDRASRVARELQFGHVAINSGQGPAPEAPFGGMKQSGFGREGGIEGMLEYCELQTVAIA